MKKSNRNQPYTNLLTKNMRLIKIIIIACLLSSGWLFGQRNIDLNNPKIEQLKIGFLTERMELTTKEAQQFWPLYNEYNQQMRLIKGKTRLKMEEIKLSVGSAPDKELENLADELISYKLKEGKVFENYYPKFKSILPIEKVLRFYWAEEEFPRWVLKQIRQNQQDQGANRPRMNRN